MKVVKAMKKIIAHFLVLASLICAFSACAGGAATTSGTESTLESTSASTTKASTAYPTLTPEEEEPQLVFHLDFSPSSLKDGKYIDLAGNGHDGIIHGNVENENGSAKFAGSLP